jgi:RNA polymerase sigma-70 factor (ECF subfamily)
VSDDAVVQLQSLGRADVDDPVVERSLVDRARTDRAAFAALYRMHVRTVFGFAYRRCGSKEVAEEATSATFERALRSFDQFEWRAGGMRPWLLRIASNEVAEIYRVHSRGESRRGQMAMRALANDATAVDSSGGAERVDLAAMHAALDRLPERYRAVISLRYLAGLSANDASAEMECSNTVLAVTLHRALGALRREMQHELIDVKGGAR